MIVKTLLEDQYEVASMKYKGLKKPIHPKIHNTLYSMPHTVIDLGAGTGTIIFRAADEAFNQNLSTKFVAVEIHPTLVFWMQLRRLFHPNRKNIRILRTDMFKFDEYLVSSIKYKGLGKSNLEPVTIYLYVDRGSLARLKPKLLKLPEASRILTYMYPLPELKPFKTHQGKHKLFEYNIK